MDAIREVDRRDGQDTAVRQTRREEGGGRISNLDIEYSEDIYHPPCPIPLRHLFSDQYNSKTDQATPAVWKTERSLSLLAVILDKTKQQYSTVSVTLLDRSKQHPTMLPAPRPAPKFSGRGRPLSSGSGVVSAAAAGPGDRVWWLLAQAQDFQTQVVPANATTAQAQAQTQPQARPAGSKTRPKTADFVSSCTDK